MADKIVYSSESGGGRRIETGRRPKRGRGEPSTKSQGSRAVRPGRVVVRFEKSGRKGKGVTLIEGIVGRDLASIAKQLKSALGTGGSVENGVIEIQGDHRSTLVDRLAAFDIVAKRGN